MLLGLSFVVTMTWAVVLIMLAVDDSRKVVALLLVDASLVLSATLEATVVTVVAVVAVVVAMVPTVVAVVVSMVVVVVVMVVVRLVDVCLDEDQGHGPTLVDFDLPLVFVGVVLENGVVSGPQGGYENVNIEMRIPAIDEGV